MKERIHFINILKVICFAMIIYYHSVVEAQMRLGVWLTDTGGYDDTLYSTPNTHIATLAVGMFFLLSGMGLMLSLGRSEHIDLGKYYKKRVIRILIPYWTASIIFMGIFWHFQLPDGIPKWRLIFNVFALDGILAAVNYSTFYIMVGEWFMGPLIIMYVLFPFLCKALKKHPRITMGVMAAVYVIRVLMFHFEVGPMITAVFTNPLVKICDFVLGMHLAQVWKKLDKRAFLISLIIIALYILLPVTVQIPLGFRISIIIIAMFVAFAYLEPWFAKFPRINKFFDICCKYSYEVYLVHHGVIIFVMTYFMAYNLFGGNVKILLIVEVLLGIFSGVVLHYICNFINLVFKELGKGIRRLKRGKLKR